MVDDRPGHRLRRASARAAIRMSSAAPCSLFLADSLAARLPRLCVRTEQQGGPVVLATGPLKEAALEPRMYPRDVDAGILVPLPAPVKPRPACDRAIVMPGSPGRAMSAS